MYARPSKGWKLCPTRRCCVMTRRQLSATTLVSIVTTPIWEGGVW